MLFQDRQDAGKKLAEKLLDFEGNPNALVLALPRGGVVLGDEISKRLHIPMDLILVRKLGVPWQEELAFGAIAVNDTCVLNEGLISALNLTPTIIEKITSKERQELERRNQLYRQGKPFPDLANRIVILVDDGIATGATIRAAVKVVSTMQPSKIVVASPLAASSVYQDMADLDIDLRIVATPEPFYGIGMWYRDFPQLDDQQVIALLKEAKEREENG